MGSATWTGPVTASGGLEVLVAPEVTSTGAEVIAIGRPRMHAGTPLGDLALRVGAGRVFAVDGGAVTAWDLGDGTRMTRVEAAWQKDSEIALSVSADGRRMAYGHYEELVLADAPFTAALFSLKRARPFHFAPDGQSLAVKDGFGVGIVEVGKAAVIAKSPRVTTSTTYLDVAEQDGIVYWIRDTGVVRWDRAAQGASVSITAAVRWRRAQIAAQAPVAIVVDAQDMLRLDLVGNHLKKIGSAEWFFAISPSGSRVVVAHERQMRVLSADDGHTLSAFTATAPVARLAYSEREDTFAYGDDSGQLHVVDVGSGECAFGSPSRFVGWTANSAATIEDHGTLIALDPVTRTTTPLASPTLAPAIVATNRVNMTADAVVVEDRDGKPIARLTLDTAGDDPALARTYVAAAASTTGMVAVVRQQAVFPGGGRPDPDAGKPVPPCSLASDGSCQQEYYGELWKVGNAGRPTRVWQARLDGRHRVGTWTEVKQLSAPITFSHEGSRVLFAFADGDVLIVDGKSGASRTESLHHAAVDRIVVAPDNRFVLTEDRAGEQRIWTVPTLATP